jgi:PhnB protein
MSELTPYICVSDSRAAIDWYGEVFSAAVQGKPYVMDDGRVGHIELRIGDALVDDGRPVP